MSVLASRVTPFVKPQVDTAFDKQCSRLVMTGLQDYRPSAGDGATVYGPLDGIGAEYCAVCLCTERVGRKYSVAG